MDMVREQYEGTRNASKVSGACGKLMCCLSFEKGKEKKADKKKAG
jgi:cell fate regulator YaaT (PSP1 superfamily)